MGHEGVLKPWFVWLPASLFAFYMVFIQSSMGVMIGPLKDSFQLDSFGIGLLSASFYYTYSLLQVPIGTLIDRFGVRIVLVLSTAGTFISCLIFAYSGSVITATFARVLMGLFTASSISSAFFIGAVWFPKGYFALVVGLSEMSAMLGGAFSTKFLATSVHRFGWRKTVVICAFLGFIIFLLTVLLVRNRRANILDDNKAARKVKILDNLKIVLKNKRSWIAGVYAGFVFAPLAAIGFLWGVPFIREAYGYSLGKAGGAVSMIFIGAVIGTPILGHFSEKYKINRLSMYVFTILNLLLTVVLIYCTILPLYLLYVVFFLIGCFCTVYVIPFGIVKDDSPEHVCGTAMAFTNVLCGCIGSLFFQPLTGWIISMTVKYCHRNGDISILTSYKIGLSIIPISMLAAIFLINQITKKKSIISNNNFS